MLLLLLLVIHVTLDGLGREFVLGFFDGGAPKKLLNFFIPFLLTLSNDLFNDERGFGGGGGTFFDVIQPCDADDVFSSSST